MDFTLTLIMIVGSNGSLMVHELISPDRTWNEVEVRAKFPSFGAGLILDIPLRSHISKTFVSGNGDPKAIIMRVPSWDKVFWTSRVTICLFLGKLVENVMEASSYSPKVHHMQLWSKIGKLYFWCWNLHIFHLCAISGQFMVLIH